MSPAEQYPVFLARGPVNGREGRSLARFFHEKVSLFKRVPLPVLQNLACAVQLRRYARGQYVCRTGDTAHEIWVVKEGRICVNQCGWKGNRLSIEIMVPGDVSGLAAVACSTYPGEVMAMRDTVLAAIPRRVILHEIERNPVLAREILYAYGQKLHYIEVLLALSREPVDKRLAAALLYLYHKFGFTLPLMRSEVGDMAGTTPETAMRVLSRFEKQGLLRRGRGCIIIRDLAGLKARLDLNPSVRF
ncbi:MAG: Crp/Fnr family transcriptional regulator [Elusimicrobiota bacterium]|jgi:CRP-like cAMP-binding protein